MPTDAKTRDTVTSLLNYDVSDNDDPNDPFREIDTTLHEPTPQPTTNKRKATKDHAPDTLGLDDEVKITKKRQPVVKLDEARLLSQAGIPKLRALARSRSIAAKLRLKGKGHEYSDAAKLLSYYQLWLDNLYPRARFADGLQLVERVGHGKRMQVMRKEWIDEGKPGHRGEGQDGWGGGGQRQLGEGEAGGKTAGQAGNQEVVADAGKKANDSILGSLDEGDADDLFFADFEAAREATHDEDREPDEDELDGLLAEHGINNGRQESAADEVTDEDLDALLAEQAARRPRTDISVNSVQEEARAHEADDQQRRPPGGQSEQPDQSREGEQRPQVVSEGEDEDELEALLAEQTARPA